MPSVFGRGGEDALARAAASVPSEVVTVGGRLSDPRWQRDDQHPASLSRASRGTLPSGIGGSAKQSTCDRDG